MEPKHLAVLRHAKSSWDDPSLDDHDRPLTSRGENAAARIGRYLLSQGILPDLVLCSSARRARQTLQLLHLDPMVEVLVEDALYSAGDAELKGRLCRVADSVTSVLLIGHNPGIQELAIALCGTDERVASFPTAALADFRVWVSSWVELGPGTAALNAFVTPRELD